MLAAGAISVALSARLEEDSAGRPVLLFVAAGQPGICGAGDPRGHERILAACAIDAGEGA